jgi:uncharacterized protein (TIGR02118 family)
MTTAKPDDAYPMARLIIMWSTPSDIEAFERHYRDVHIPLAKRLPGLRRGRPIRANPPGEGRGGGCG